MKTELVNSTPARWWSLLGLVLVPLLVAGGFLLAGLTSDHRFGQVQAAVVNLDVPQLELVRRLDARSRTEAKMPYDSSAATIVNRLEEHQVRTLPVLDYYAGQVPVVEANGTGSPAEVFQNLVSPVKKAMLGLK